MTREAVEEELAGYVMDSFGNRQRIDYGTGHELHFIIFLLCLDKIGFFAGDRPAVLAVKVFAAYLDLVRTIQVTYCMEPAGSRGVWCLDDHQFVPFIWGGHQLIDHPSIVPDDVLKPALVHSEAANWLYLSCIDHILRVKTGPFFEHSPDLYNISGAQNWFKIGRGMLLKYKDDVLSKWPVMQHLLFGTLFPYTA